MAADLQALGTRRGVRLSRLAPRGSAKSTWATLAYPLRCLVEAAEPYTMILSDTQDQAGKFLSFIRAEFEVNDRLKEDYPGCTTVGGDWQKNRLQLAHGPVVEALSTGGRIRGRRNRAARPSLIVIDDPQGNQDIVSPTERQRAWDWLTREVIPAGDENTNFVCVGTALHREAVAVRLLTTPGWDGKVYRSVEKWPDRSDLWQHWERLLTNLADPDRDRTARAYYDANKAAMDAGAEVLWPEGRDLYALMRRRAEIGPSAFDTEDQGNPVAYAGAEWPSSYFDRPGFWFADWPNLVARVQSLDPSKGSASKPGDYQAHIRLGLAPDGTLYVDADLRREPVPDMVSRGVDLATAADWGGRPLAYAVEDNDALGLLLPEFDRECRRRTTVLPLKGIRNTLNKVVRIRRLGAYLAGGRVRVRDTPGGRVLVDQMRDFPGGDFDDGPDALELAVRVLEHLTLGR